MCVVLLNYIFEHTRVMSCLLEKLFVGSINDGCKNALMPVQYFINRDFTLDPALYQACYSDASRICKASKDWLKESKGNLILPCLAQYYRPFILSSTGAKYKVNVYKIHLIIMIYCNHILYNDNFCS